jgi:hypothetical protein
MRSPSLLALASSFAIPALAAAHPGHGLDPSGMSLSHWLGEPVHALPLFAVLCIVAALWGLVAREHRAS